MSEPSLAEMFNLPCPDQIDLESPILVIDGDEDTRLLLVHQLQKLHFKEIVHLDSAYDALCHIREKKTKFSVIICTHNTPIMSGHDFLQELRNNNEFERGPFLMAIDNPNKEKLMFALENGVDEVIVKPYKLEDIAPKIRSTFKLFHNRKNPEKVYELAKNSMRKQDLVNAEKIYNVIASHTQKAARPLVGLAQVEFAKGNTKEALKILQKAEQRNPNFVHVYAERGDILASEGDTSGAIVAYQQAIHLSPLNPERYESCSRLFAKINKYECIIEILQIAESNNLDFPALHTYMAKAYYMLRQFKRSTIYLKTAIKYDSSNAELLNYLGVCYKEQRLFDEAAKVYNSIIKMDPDNVEVLFNKAILMHAQKRVKDAIKLLERVQKKDPEHIGAKALLAEFRSEMGGAA